MESRCPQNLLLTRIQRAAQIEKRTGMTRWQCQGFSLQLELKPASIYHFSCYVPVLSASLFFCCFFFLFFVRWNIQLDNVPSPSFATEGYSIPFPFPPPHCILCCVLGAFRSQEVRLSMRMRRRRRSRSKGLWSLNRVLRTRMYVLCMLGFS